ncbi:MAG: cation-transporting P-type ATPase [Planctomycetes bacterium]|nr:cation-transporting P-type ATPase [Planctomycetota bacterium]
MHKKEVLSQPWTNTVEEIMESLDVSRLEGLDSHQVHSMRKNYGHNRLREARKKGIAEILIAQFKNIIVILLAVAGVLSFCFDEPMNGFAIIGVIFINAAIGFIMEFKAVRSMEALHQMEKVTAKVRRAGKMQEISAKELVVGDIVLLEGGDIISADLRLLTAAKLQVDESILTGESLPVTKSIEPIEADASLGDRFNMLFKGTSATRGSGEAMVTAVGMQTELGKITDLVQKAESGATPLEKRLDSLGRNLLWVTLVLIVIIAVTGIFRGKDPWHMVEMAIALAVAAIPEGLPIVATLALARGMLRMAKQNALVNNLAAVETLGGVSVICTDKTGTLTENKMTVTELIFSDERVAVGPLDDSSRGKFSIDGNAADALENDRVKKLLEVGVLCNNASLNKIDGKDITGIGDPLEVAFLVLAQKAGIDYEQVNRDYPEEAEDAFDSDTKKMATFNKTEKGYWIAAKGAMESILDDSTTMMNANGSEEMTDTCRKYWLDQNLALAEKGYRVLALAMKHEDALDADPYKGLEFIGLACMEDPAREDVKDAIEACRSAGIRTVMITGDHPKTAASIAASIRLTGKEFEDAIIGKDIMPVEDMTDADKDRYRNASVFARVSPKQKLDLIAVHQDAGACVAMTGDGVNDAPALKKADIGIAMGQRGTQVAQEAADMVLKDDSFSTIIIAVEQGRIIFENIRKFVIYLLSCNISEVMVVFAASLVNAPLPLLPLQILFLNLVTDVFPALALGVGNGSTEIMKDKPRSSDEPILPREGWYKILGFGTIMSVAVLTAFTLAFKMLKMDEEGAVTISFLTLAFAQLWHIFNMRGANTRFANNEVVKNRFVWGALGLCTALLIAAVYTPMADVLKLSDPGIKGWTLIIVASSMTCVAGEIWRFFTERNQE